jgi:uncharacterized membrane protein YfcA
MHNILLAVIGVSAIIFAVVFLKDVQKQRQKYRATPGLPLTGASFVAAFFDTLGIGGFATLTSFYKFTKLVDDRVIPGTLNVGFCLPVVAQAFIFITVVKVDPLTLISMMLAATLGAVIGAGIVSKLPVDKIRLGLGGALVVVALTILAGLLKLYPVGGDALGLAGWKLVFAVIMSFVLGSLMTIGIGFYAPCMALVYALGMNPLAAFPIMMGSCAMLQPWAGIKFVKSSAYNPKAAFALTAAGIVAVLLAAYVVKSLPLTMLKWVVVVVILYTAVMMFRSIGKEKAGSAGR